MWLGKGNRQKDTVALFLRNSLLHALKEIVPDCLSRDSKVTMDIRTADLFFQLMLTLRVRLGRGNSAQPGYKIQSILTQPFIGLSHPFVAFSFSSSLFRP